MTPPLGLILTHASSIVAVRTVVQAARADILKVVPGWGLDNGWTSAAIAEAAGLAPILVVRSTWGDPSYDNGRRAMPFANQIAAELAPWLSIRPDAWIELGNEPLLVEQPEQFAWDYLAHLSQTIDLLRQAYPRAKIIAPAHMRNHAVRLGEHANGQDRWDAMAAATYRRCDALGLHAYSVAQAVSGIKALREYVSKDLPIWLTEFALNEALGDDARGRRYLEILDALPVAAATLYHLVERPGADPVHFNPNYTLRLGTLAALANRSRRPSEAPLGGTPVEPDTVLHKATLTDFDLDVRQWRTVEAFRRHLANYDAAEVAPWAKGATVHHTISPLASTWRGLASILAMARHYRDNVDNGPGQPKGGWRRGPHLFIVSGAPNARDNGIWQMTPLNLRGTHAKSFNGSHHGLEFVGNFDRLLWPPDLAVLGIGALAALFDWTGLAVTATSLNGHRDDPKTDKTCPGSVIDLVAVRRGVAALQRGGL